MTESRPTPGGRRLGIAVLAGLLAVTGCAAATPIEDARVRVERLLESEQSPVSRVTVSQDRLVVTLAKDGSGTVWELFPESAHDPYDVRAAAMPVADFPVDAVIGRAEDLAADCDAESYAADARVVTGTAILTTLVCGTDERLLLNDRELAPMPADWAPDTLAVLWEELGELTRESRVEGIFFADDQLFVTLLPESGTNAQCRTLWRRDVAKPGKTLAACRDPRHAVETFDLNLVTPERLGGTILAAKSELGLPPDAVLGSVLVITQDGAPAVQVTDGNNQVVLPIR